MESTDKTQHAYLGDVLRRLERSYPLRMSFSHEIEKRFQRNYSARYLFHIRIALVIGLLSILATGAIEIFLIDFHRIFYSWMLRGVSFAVLAVGWWYTNKPRDHAQRVIFWGSLLLSWAALEFARINEAPYKHLYYSALLYVQIFAFALSRLQIKWAIPCSLLIFFVGNYYIWVLDSLAIQDRFIIFCMLIAGSAVSMTVCYLLERAVRISYLQRELLGLENEFLQQNNLRLRDELVVDSLTGVTNRRGFDSILVEEWDRAQRNQYLLALILFDVDFFKQYNDTYGHQAGDQCLTKIASVPKAMIRRAGDSVARYGGEEFTVILMGTSLDDARMFAEEMRERVIELAIPHDRSTISDVVTISCGVAAIIPSQLLNHDELIKLADSALYEAKRAGRNRVVCSPVSSAKKEVQSKKTA